MSSPAPAPEASAPEVPVAEIPVAEIPVAEVPAAENPTSDPAPDAAEQSKRPQQAPRRAGPAAQIPPPPTNCIVLKNLDYKITQAELEEVVRRVAGGRKEFVNIALIDDKNTGSFRGMAFVNFHTTEDATSALGELSKMVINKRKVFAEYRRLRPGEKERRDNQEKRNKKFDQGFSRQTFERDIAPEFDAEGKAVDKRTAFFARRDTLKKVDDQKRVVEKSDREKEREADFRARLVAYRDAVTEDGSVLEDLTFDNSLTSYERRMVHMICDEFDLGHISRLNDNGLRELHVTKDPELKAQWAEATAEIRAAVIDKRKEEADEKRKKREAQKGERTAAASGDGRSSPDWKSKSETTTGGPATEEELKGIKWFVPRSAQNSDGEKGSAASMLRPPSYKLYIPPRQPTGPDGTIGFTSRNLNSAKSSEKDDDTANAGGDDQRSDESNASGSEIAEKRDGAGSGTENVSRANAAAPGATGGSSDGQSGQASTSQSILNPSVPAFTPSLTNAMAPSAS